MKFVNASVLKRNSNLNSLYNLKSPKERIKRVNKSYIERLKNQKNCQE